MNEDQLKQLLREIKDIRTSILIVATVLIVDLLIRVFNFHL